MRRQLESTAQRCDIHWKGVTCAITRMSLPRGKGVDDRPIQSYLRPSKCLHSAMPMAAPIRLHVVTSSTQWSHQHSLKLGSTCCSDTSTSSHVSDHTHNSAQSRTMNALTTQPKMCASTKTSALSRTFAHGSWGWVSACVRV